MTDDRSHAQINRARKEDRGGHDAATRKLISTARTFEGMFLAERRRADKLARGLAAAQADNTAMRRQITAALGALDQVRTPTIGTSMSRHLDRVLALVTAARERLMNGDDL